MAGESLEARFASRSFSSSLDLVEQKLNASVGTAVEGRIVTPFEARVDRNTITEEALLRYAQLRIECYLSHIADGGLILSTGSKQTTAYDFGPEIQKMSEKRRSLIEEQGFLSGEDVVEFSALYAIRNAVKTKEENMKTEQPFCAHQHPSGKLSLSPGDILASALLESEIDIVFTDAGAIFYKVSPGQVERLKEWGEKNFATPDDEYQRGFESFIESEGLIKKAVMFGTPDMKEVVSFMRGEKTWDEIR